MKLAAMQIQTLILLIPLLIQFYTGSSHGFEADELLFHAGDLGKIRGVQYETYKTKRPFIQITNIPYAVEPVGDKRFAPPQEIATPLTPVDANGEFSRVNTGPCCPQTPTNFICAMTQDENCLHLNIYTPYPQNDTGELLPVIVFIHGGSFIAGSGDMFSGTRLLERDVVVVNFNYRLGVLGFFCLNTEEAPGNAGMYDMVQALRFIKKYIHHFGGDPDLITLTGQSAGSAAVTHLMISPMIKDEQLFHRAIAMSGTALNDWATTDSSTAEAASLEIAQISGCYDPSNPIPHADIIQCMKGISSANLVTILDDYQTEENSEGRLGFGPITPVIQTAGAEKFLDEHPEKILERQGQANIPFIMGTTRHDGSFVVGTVYNKFISVNNYEEDETFLRTRLVPTLLEALGLQDPTEAVFEALAELYMGREVKNSGNFTLMIPGLTDLHSVFFFKAAAFKTLKFHSRYQNQSYWYNFDYSGEHTVYRSIVNTTNNPVRGGIGHGDDLIYVFTIPLAENLLEADQLVSDRMVDYWVNFAYTGNPNIREDGESSHLHQDEGWPAFSEDFPYFASINTNDEFIPSFPNQYWQDLSHELYPELQDPIPTTSTTVAPDSTSTTVTPDTTGTTDPADSTTDDPDSSLSSASVSFILTILAVFVSYTSLM